MEGNRIRALRMKKGISLNTLSKETGISKSYLSFLEREIKSNPSLDILIKIADTLKVGLNYLIEEPHLEIEKKRAKDNALLKVQIELSEKEMDQEKYIKIKELFDYFKNK